MTGIAVLPPSVRRLGIAVASVLGPLAVFVVLRQPAGSEASGPDAVGVALVLVATLPLVMVDVRPRAAVLVSSVGVSGAMLTGHATNTEALALLIGVGLCAYRAGPHAALIAGPAGVAGIALAPALAPSGTPLASMLANGLTVVLSVMAGLSDRAQRSYAMQLEHHSRELEELRAAENREIFAQERLRIAREVHDVVGHALAAIALHARVGTRRLGRDPSGTAQSVPVAAALGQPLPVNPLLYAALALMAVLMFIAFAYWTAAWTRSAEAAQLTSMPLILLAAVGPLTNTIPDMPDWLREVLSSTPGAAMSDLVRIGWFGLDGPEATESTLTFAQTWSQAASPLLVMVAWTALAVTLARRSIRWEPRS